jgi:cupin fold WbuC family metalloprotein
MTVIEGQADALLFDDSGSVTRRVSMTTLDNRGSFSYYMPAGIYHTIIPRAPWYVFVETTQGPFDERGMEGPSWSPDFSDPEERARWFKKCDEVIASLSEEEL